MYLIHINEPFEPFLTIYPSFIYPLFDIVARDHLLVLRKSIGYIKNTVITIDMRRSIVSCENIDSIDQQVIEELLGLWFKPWNYLSDVERKYLNFIEKIIDKHGGVRIAISPKDRKWVFISVFLSRATSFHTNTVKWVKKIGLSGILDPFNTNYLSLGKNFQLKQINELLSNDSLRNTIQENLNRISSEKTAWKVRMNLVKIKYIGPKTVDALLLFSTRYSVFTPSDRHYKRFLKKFFNVELKPPIKSYCHLHTCYSCSYTSSCITGWSISQFGKLSGWLQTISYLLGNSKIVI